MAQKLSVEAITWEVFEPWEFPCFICEMRKAVVRTSLVVEYGCKIIISHCEVCGRLSAQEMVDRLEVGDGDYQKNEVRDP